MCPHITRRQFIGSTVIGGALLASRGVALRTAPAQEAGWPAPAPAKIHKVYVGRTGGIYLSRPTEEIERFNTYLAGVEERVGGIQFVGGEVLPPAEVSAVLPALADADAVLLFHLSGHGGGAPAEAMAQIVAAGKPTAVFSQPYSGHGWMYFPRWQQEGKRVVLLPTSDWGEIDRVAGLMRVAPRMAQAKVLVVRGPTGTAAACDAAAVKTRLGTELIPITVEETIAAFNDINPKAAEDEAEAVWLSQAKGVVEPTRQEVIASARYYLALKELMITYGAEAVTSSNCMGDPAKGCLAFSKLNDLGCVGACEGDMDSTLTMMMFQHAFGVPGFISDPVFDVSRNALIHFHCTCATRMDGPGGERLPFTIRTQTDSHEGVALDVEQRVGQAVTCAKFVNLDTMLLSTGTISDVTHDPLGCRTQFVTEVDDARGMFQNWGTGLLGNDTMTLLHRVVFYGDRKQSIEDLSHLMGFNVVLNA